MSNFVIFSLMVLMFIFTIFLLSCNDLVICVFLLVFILLSGVMVFPFFSGEYLFVVFLMVYLGALVVFFLFVVMLLNTRSSGLFESFHSFFLKSSIFVVCYFFAVMCVISVPFPSRQSVIVFSYEPQISCTLTNPELFGLMLFDGFGLVLIVISAVLTVTIIGVFTIFKNK